jgi:hypothetical protein
MRMWWLACVAACHGGGDKHKPGVGSASTPFELVSGSDAAVTGPSGDEVEPNDTDDTATPLAIGAMVRGKIEPETDIDRYRIMVTEAGALSVVVSPVEADLALDIEDASGTVIAKSDRGGVRTKEGVPNLGVQPGRYTAVVREIKHRSRHGSAESKPAPVYELTAQMVPVQPGAEREPDDDRGTANDLIIGDTGTGYIGWSGDSDVWKLSVEALAAKDALDVELSAVDGVAYDVELDDGVGSALVHRKAPRGAPMIVRGLVPVVPAGAPPFHYVVIKATGSNPEVPYSLRVSGHVVGTDAEIEPDDTPEHPFAWPVDRTVVHGTWTPGDVDCYALPLTGAARDVTATIDPSGELDVVAELLVDGHPVAASAGGAKGSAQKVTGSVPPNAHAIVRVKGADDRATAEGTYDITLQDGA